MNIALIFAQSLGIMFVEMLLAEPEILFEIAVMRNLADELKYTASMALIFCLG